MPTHGHMPYRPHKNTHPSPHGASLQKPPSALAPWPQGASLPKCFLAIGTNSTVHHDVRQRLSYTPPSCDYARPIPQGRYRKAETARPRPQVLDRKSHHLDRRAAKAIFIGQCSLPHPHAVRPDSVATALLPHPSLPQLPTLRFPHLAVVPMRPAWEVPGPLRPSTPTRPPHLPLAGAKVHAFPHRTHDLMCRDPHLTRTALTRCRPKCGAGRS